MSDYFSTQADLYKKYRPIYPEALYEWLLSLVEYQCAAWDCGTGNGQVAHMLAHSFEQVVATDISQAQLDQAPAHPRIDYRIGAASKVALEDNSVDLVTVAQAAHWFDIPAFNREADRVLRPGGLMAWWGYEILRITPELDELIHTFYHDIVGKYWVPEREHIVQRYQSLDFPYRELSGVPEFSILAEWTPTHLAGYLASWSATQLYIQQHGRNPVLDLMPSVLQLWPRGERKSVEFPVFMRVGRK